MRGPSFQCFLIGVKLIYQIVYFYIASTLSETNSAATRGTIIKAYDIFDNLPVRRNYYKRKERKTEDFKKIETLIWSFGIIHPKLRICLFHNKVLLRLSLLFAYFRFQTILKLRLCHVQGPPYLLDRLCKYVTDHPYIQFLY